MNLNGKQIVEQGIITKVSNTECIQPNGVDLELIRIARILPSTAGFIPKEGKTLLAAREDVMSTFIVDGLSQKEIWDLPIGIYDITVAQGCKIPANQRLRIVQRSSLLRNGAILSSSMFDSGFATDNIGTILHVLNPIKIEVGARIGQAYVTSSNEVDQQDLYNGQWQGDQQRSEGK